MTSPCHVTSSCHVIRSCYQYKRELIARALYCFLSGGVFIRYKTNIFRPMNGQGTEVPAPLQITQHPEIMTKILLNLTCTSKLGDCFQKLSLKLIAENCSQLTPYSTVIVQC